MRNFTILIFSTFFLLVGFAGSVSAEEQAITPIQIQSSAQSLNPEMTIQPQALPCDYYADGQQKRSFIANPYFLYFESSSEIDFFPCD
ncbi:hypothetical protein [Paenibacillus barengoltzii]|uniref:Uncharacterized protein n=1 Tax=Paenibacillus barengoltzii J12 TaxID=935846 RepID=A0ABY1LTA7_9BACL|nr:hypothetical protein [Paenibacillus barengoltzii]SME99142.1 hypothetical protein SAMN02744124_00679 [Paenibacillus barengoltzii J12]